MTKDSPGFLPEEDYKRVLGLVPVACVDVVVTLGNKFLLGKRINEPGKGLWWIPGGRVFKGETLEETAIRKIMEELGFETRREGFEILTAKETIFENSAIDGVSSHTINSVFLLRLNEKPVINLENSDFSETKWLNFIDGELHPYLKFVLDKAGFK